MSDAALRTPGLHLRAVPTETPPLSRTAVTAFVGVTERGPLDSPQVVESYGDFVSVFGDVWRYGEVGASVYGFFLNGGEEAVIVRVARKGALAAPLLSGCAAKQDLATAASNGVIADANGAATLQLSARNPGAWGNRIAASVFAEASRPMDLGRLTASAAGGANVVTVDSVYDHRVGGTLRLSHASNLFLKSAHQVTAIDETQRRLTVNPPLPAHGYPSGSAVSGPGFRLVVGDGARREVFDGLSMNPSHPRFFVDAVNGPANLPYLELARRGHSLLVVAAQVFGPLGQSRFKPTDTVALTFAGGADGLTFATGTLDDGAAATLLATSLVPGRAGAGTRLAAAPFSGRLSLAVPPESGGAKDLLVFEDIRGWAAGDTLALTHASNPAVTETAIIAGVNSDEHRVDLVGALANDYPIGSTATVANRFNLDIEAPPGTGENETFWNLSMAAGPRSFATIVNGPGGSRLVCLSAAVPAGATPSGTAVLNGGSDPDEVPLAAFTGYSADGSLFQPPGAIGPVGMAALEAVTAVSLVAIPDLVGRADLSEAERILGQTQALYHCQKMGERFAVLDVPRGLEPADALVWPENFNDPRFARYGALYYPWLDMVVAGGERSLPPSGVMAGLFARVDRQSGVGRAPANVQLRGVVGLKRDIDAAAQGELNDAGVNCIRKFEVGALRLWGARTLSREDQYLYVHARRVVLLVIKGLSLGLRWAVFEPNDASLQKRVKAAIDGFLRGVLSRTLPQGARAEDAYFVNVGDGLNTQATRDAGQLIAEVGIAVAKPAEFIVITVKRTPDILTLVEEEA
jgi:hypothetical protein